MIAKQTTAGRRRTTPQLGQWWWVPATVVILALLVLLVVPAAIDHHAKDLRESVTAGEHARTALNDFEASLATELLERADTALARRISQATENKLDSDLGVLHTTLAEIDGEGRVHYDSLSNLLEAWRASLRHGDHTATAEGLKLIAAAETLDAYLTEFVDRHRDVLLSMTRYNLLIPMILAPIAVSAALLSMWLARRLQLFATIAESERMEVVRASESRAALLRGVTHDVKNPLGAANGYAQLLEEGVVGPLEPAQVNMVRRIRHLLGTSIQTVTDLLELARADGTLHLEYAETDLAVLMNDVVDDHRGMALERQILINASGATTIVVSDPLRVRQVLANLVTNAIKYTPRGGSVRARIVHLPERVGIVVEDTGPGIPAELEPRLFEEFFRVRTGANEMGNGLGLSISRRIGRLLGGDVTYDRIDCSGSAFTLWLPRTTT